MRHAAFVLAVFAAGCSFPVESGQMTRDAVGVANGAGGDARSSATHPLTFQPGAKRFVVLGHRSHLDVTGHDSVLGNHALSFARWWAHIEADPPRIVVEIDLRSLHSDEGFVTSIVKDHLLEVDRYPHATLVGSLSATSRAGEIVIDGVADIHGKQIPLRFVGQLRAEGDGLRVHASFDMSRRAFDLSYAPAEAFLDDRFHVSVDAVASAERVEVEEQ